jgi:hypothetical protein
VDQVAHLTRVLEAHGSTSSVAAKLDALLDLEQVRDPRVLGLMLQILADTQQPTEVRLYVLKHTRNGTLATTQRPRVARVLLDLLEDRSSSALHLQAILALGEFTDVDGVVIALCVLARDAGQALELRHAAYSSLDRTGPTPAYIALLNDLAADDTFGLSARTTLAAWARRPEHQLSKCRR